MNFGKALKSIAGPLLGVASTLIPGGPAILGAINAFMPEDKKLPATATGAQMHQAVNDLTPESRASLMEKELEVEIQEIKSWEGIQASLAQADAAGASTRPRIAVMMAQVVVFTVLAFVSVWVVAIYQEDIKTLDLINSSWGTILAVIATPTALLRSYFGMRTKEKQSRYAAASGNETTGALAGIIKAFKG